MGMVDDLKSKKPRKFEAWQQFRRDNPRQYYSATVQNQIARDIEALGSEQFFAKEQDT